MSLPTPGLYRDLSQQDYERLDAVRASLLLKFRRSAAHARHEIEHPSDPSDAMVRGSAVHTAILEPDKLTERFAPSPAQQKKTKADKDAWAKIQAEHPDCQILRPSEWDHVCRMRDAVWSHPTAKVLLSGPGRNEASLVWRDPATKLMCKARPDRMLQHYVSPWDDQRWPAIVDLKTSKDASPDEFARSILNFGYDVQAAHYLAGADVLGPCERKWVFIVVESTAPHCVAVYELEHAALERGQRLRERYLAMLAECEATGKWPGYPAGVSFVGLPSWVYKREESAA